MSNSKASCNGSDLKANYGLAADSNDGCGIKKKSNIKAVDAPGARVIGNFGFPAGSAGRVVIHGADHASITVGGERGSANVPLVFKSVSGLFDTILRCDVAKSVTAAAWTAETPFGSNLVVSDQIHSLAIAGDLTNFELDVVGGSTQAGKITVGGTLTNAYFLLPTGAQSLSAQRMVDSTVSCGVLSLPEGQTLPDSLAQFSAADSRLGRLSLRGKGETFAGSIIAARKIGALSLGGVRLDNAGATFGVAADTISSLRATDTTTHKKIQARRLDDPSTWAAELAASGVDWKDFAVNVV